MIRIVSLLPGITEVVCELGFENQMVGRSHECDKPSSVKDLPALTFSSVNNTGDSMGIHKNITSIIQNGLSIFNVDVELLEEINPDIIFTQDHCEVCAVSFKEVELAVRKTTHENTEIVSLSPTTLHEIFQSILKVGQVLNADEDARELVNNLKLRMDIIRNTVIGEPVKRVACIEWIDPMMTGGNWIPELLEIVGAEYLLSEPGKHSPIVNWDDIIDENPDVILIVPCGYKIDQTTEQMHLMTQKKMWNSLKAVQNDEVYIMDGNYYFNRPGTSIFESTRILGEILHPELFKPINHNSGWIRFSPKLQQI